MKVKKLVWKLGVEAGMEAESGFYTQHPASIPASLPKTQLLASRKDPTTIFFCQCFDAIDAGSRDKGEEAGMEACMKVRKLVWKLGVEAGMEAESGFYTQHPYQHLYPKPSF